MPDFTDYVLTYGPRRRLRIPWFLLVFVTFVGLLIWYTAHLPNEGTASRDPVPAGAAQVLPG